MANVEKKSIFFNKSKDTDLLKRQLAEYSSQIEAISKSQAVIEFKVDGTIITANDNFLDAMGYTLDEVQGQHHSIFVTSELANSARYKEFWESLKNGEYQAREFKRIAKGGRDIWIQASYNPILDEDGKTYKVIKIATDITQRKLEHANFVGQIDAINKSQAVIEFNLDGTIITANDNFLNTVGYSLNEIKGQHHSKFVEPDYGKSTEYAGFWKSLSHGEYQSGEFKRIGKGGKEVWIQASYNPIFDLNNKPYKVVKYASDITHQKSFQLTIDQILNEVGRVVTALADGKLYDRVNGEFEGQFKELQESINGYCDKLSEMVTQIRNTGESVNKSSSDISSGTQNLSARTETLAAGVEETAATMNEMISSVQKNAENANLANEVSSNASQNAQKGSDIVGAAVAAMKNINQSSSEISKIISVIDEIAFQTNLLALNAAVEAARAGEQGRGFAVVATEVRNLAGRSADAAKEIKELIEDSVNKIDEGTQFVNQSGEMLETIVSSVKEVSEYVEDIAHASKEQATGIDLVNKAIMTMDETTQNNAALVDQASSASESMVQQGRELVKLMQFFKIRDRVNNSAPAKQENITEERRAADRPWSNNKNTATDVTENFENQNWAEF